MANGLALSVGTEFIENERMDVEKQDCELKAFYRLVKTLKADFPQTRVCLLLDGLFACAPVLSSAGVIAGATSSRSRGTITGTFQDYGVTDTDAGEYTRRLA